MFLSGPFLSLKSPERELLASRNLPFIHRKIQTEGAHHCHQGNPPLSSDGGLVDAHGPWGSRLSQSRLPAHTQMAVVTSAPPRGQPAQLTAVAQSPGHESPRTGPRQGVSGPQRRLLPPAEAFAPLICASSLGMPWHPTIIPSGASSHLSSPPSLLSQAPSLAFSPLHSDLSSLMENF